jgi:hypothetical protein
MIPGQVSHSFGSRYWNKNTSRGPSSVAGNQSSYDVALSLRPSPTIAQDDLDDYITQNDLQFTPSKTVLDFYIKMDFIQRATVRFANHALNSEAPEVSEGELPSILCV